MGKRGIGSSKRRQGWAALALGGGIAVVLSIGPAPEVAVPAGQSIEVPVAYVVDASVSRVARASVRAAMTKIAGQSDVTFVRRTSEATYLDIFAGPRCFSSDAPDVDGARAVSLGAECSSAAGATRHLRTALGLGAPASE